VSELPKGWIPAPLGQLSEYVTSGSRDWSRFYSSEGALFIRTQDINTNRLTATGNIARVSLPERVEGKRTLIKPGDLLITITGANVGKCARVVGSIPEAYVSQSVALVRLVDPIMGRFIHYQLIAPSEDVNRTQLQQSAYGLGRPVLSLDNVRNVALAIAPAREQDRIAAKLDGVLAKVDACRQRLNRVPQFLKRFREAVLEAAISGRLTEEWRMETGKSAEGWRKMLLPQACKQVTDGEHISPARSAEGIPLLTAKNVTDKGVSFHDTHFVTQADAERFWRRCRPEDGDVLVCSRGTIGRCAPVSGCRQFCLMGTVILLKPNREVLHPEFLLTFIAAPGTQQVLRRASGATAVSALYLRDIQKLEIAVPSSAEQREIVRRVNELTGLADAVESRYTDAVSRVEKLTPSVLAKAFRGELVPQDPNDEPAEKLLERVLAASSAPIYGPHQARSVKAQGKVSRTRPPRKGAVGSNRAPRARG
jgi:type I restriction enzyme S subunit